MARVWSSEDGAARTPAAPRARAERIVRPSMIDDCEGDDVDNTGLEKD